MSNYIRHQRDGKNIISGAYFSNDRWHIIEMTYDNNWSNVSESLIDSVRDKRFAELQLETRTGSSITLQKRAIRR